MRNIEQSLRAASSASSSSDKATIVVCSDCGDFQRSLSAVLVKHDVRVMEPKDEAAAFHVLRGNSNPLVILDERFSGRDGLSFVTMLQRGNRQGSLPVIVSIADESAASVERAYRSGAADYIVKPLNLSVVVQRITHLQKVHKQQRELEEQQHYLSKYDPLTGLYNRQFFNQKLERSMQKTVEEKHVSALLIIDVDNFKRINNSFNFHYGDGLLQQVANRLLSCLRDSDLLTRVDYEAIPQQGLARLGGDEFILFVENVGNEENACSVASRCLEAISEPLNLQGQNVVLTGSAGIAMYPLDGQKVHSLMKNAEKAMYGAKERGGNCYTCYKQEMNLADESSFILENDLRDALENDQLLLHYQPQVDSRCDKVVSLEVLCRWSHPYLGMVSPDRFIPIAEESSLIVPIGEWVLETACKQAKIWLDEGRELARIAVNVSAFQFCRQDFVERTQEILQKTGLPAQYLELELTESLIMSDAEENIAKLGELKKLGLALAVDDFGTGYSSLAYLKRLPIDTLKIDRSFVANIGDGSIDGAIVGAILALAGKLGLQVVAEGVEDIEQLTFLRDNNCDIIQGYYFSPAKSVEEVTSLIGCTMTVAPEVVLDSAPALASQ